MQYKLTIFKSVYDVYTNRQMTFDSWEEVEELLVNLSKQPGYKPTRGALGEPVPSDQWSPLISPAYYDRDSSRKNANVKGWGSWAALDIDDYECSFEEAIAPFQGIRHIIYSSASSSVEHPKFRVVIPFDRLIPADEIKRVWYALNTKYNELADPQTKDLSRMYYVPAQYPDAYNFIQIHSGPFVNLSQLLEEYPLHEIQDNSFRSSLSSKLQEQLMQYKMEQLTNRDIKWTSYRDCPFVNQALVMEYRAITETGWYAKMYHILCSIAASAIRMEYPISAAEIASLAREIDTDTGGWYANRPLEMEAQRALDYALSAL